MTQITRSNAEHAEGAEPHDLRDFCGLSVDRRHYRNVS
jgi:hypothetical protein